MSAPLREILARFALKVEGRGEVREADRGVDGLIGKLRGLGSALVGGALVMGVRNFAHGLEQTGGALDDAAQRLGTTTTALQEYRYAASQLAGVRAESLDTALTRLNLSLEAAGQGATNQVKAFGALGVVYRDASGGVKQVGEAFPEILDGFAKITSPTERSRLAMDLFGKQGLKLLPFLSKGRAGLEEFQAEFASLGGGMSVEGVKAAADYGDAVERVDLAVLGLKNTIGVELLPRLGALVERAAKVVAAIRSWVAGSRILTVVAVAAGAALAKMAIGLIAVNGPLLLAVAGYAALALAVEDLVSLFAGDQSVFGDAIDDLFGLGTAASYVVRVVNAARLAWLMLKGALSGDMSAAEAEAQRQRAAGESILDPVSADEKRARSSRGTAADKAARAQAAVAGDPTAYLAASDPNDRAGAFESFKRDRSAAVRANPALATDTDRATFDADLRYRGPTVAPPIAASGGNSRTVNQNVNVAITVPPGSNYEQANQIKRLVSDAIGSEFRKAHDATAEAGA